MHVTTDLDALLKEASGHWSETLPSGAKFCVGCWRDGIGRKWPCLVARLAEALRERVNL